VARVLKFYRLLTLLCLVSKDGSSKLIHILWFLIFLKLVTSHLKAISQQDWDITQAMYGVELLENVLLFEVE
jgi:hypothetical protein